MRDLRFKAFYRSRGVTVGVGVSLATVRKPRADLGHFERVTVKRKA